MGTVMLVASRELKSYFTTWMGYVIIFASLLINGLLFNAYAIGKRPKFSADVLSDFFYYSSGIGMVAAIFLAMRLLAEERQSGTLILFFTSPINDRQIIYGKFLSSLVVFLLLQLFSLYLPLLILVEGKISIGHLVSGYLGVTLLGMGVLSISLFASVISPNQMIAGVVGASITVILLILWIAAHRVDEPFRSLFSYLAIHNIHFTSFSRGLLHIRDIVFYLSLVFFFLECSSSG